jgi:excisionase family DNA binding protein
MPGEELEELLLPAEVARILRVTVRTVERYCKRGKLRAVKLGRLWRIPRSSLDEFLRTEESDAKRSLNRRGDGLSGPEEDKAGR